MPESCCAMLYVILRQMKKNPTQSSIVERKTNLRQMIKCSNIIPNTENYRERVDKVEDSTCVQAQRGGGEGQVLMKNVRQISSGHPERGSSWGLNAHAGEFQACPLPSYVSLIPPLKNSLFQEEKQKKKCKKNRSEIYFNFSEFSLANRK